MSDSGTMITFLQFCASTVKTFTVFDDCDPSKFWNWASQYHIWKASWNKSECPSYWSYLLFGGCCRNGFSSLKMIRRAWRAEEHNGSRNKRRTRVKLCKMLCNGTGGKVGFQPWNQCRSSCTCKHKLVKAGWIPFCVGWHREGQIPSLKPGKRFQKYLFYLKRYLLQKEQQENESSVFSLNDNKAGKKNLERLQKMNKIHASTELVEVELQFLKDANQKGPLRRITQKRVKRCFWEMFRREK